MLPLTDPRWTRFDGGYRVPFDARSLLQRLRDAEDAEVVWSEIWQELHHQGDIGQASFAVIPHLVEIYQARGDLDWNPYGFVATVELLRHKEGNPEPLADLQEGYDTAVAALAEHGLRQLRDATAPETVRSILSLLAIWKNLRSYAEVLIDFSEDEVIELRAAAFGDE